MTFSPLVTEGCINSVCEGTPAFFQSLSIGNTSCLWRFGDGNGGDACQASHVYNAPGVFDATLVAASELGCRDSLTQEIIVNPLPEPSEPFTLSSFADWDANSEFIAIDSSGIWTDYFQLNCDSTDSDTILLSILKNGEDIGSIDDGEFRVQVFKNNGVVDITELINEYAPELGPVNTALTLNYFWRVDPNYASPVADSTIFGLRFYFSQADVDVLSAAIGSNLEVEDLLFFKASHETDEYPCDDFSLIEDLSVQVFTNGASPSTREWKADDFTFNSVVGTMDIVGFSCGGIFAILPSPGTHSDIEEIILSPNPSAGDVRLTFHAKNPENLNLSVFNSLGQLILERRLPVLSGLNQPELSLGQFSSGIYFLRLQFGTGKEVYRKLILITN